jgi:hypothetical protein
MDTVKTRDPNATPEQPDTQPSTPADPLPGLEPPTRASTHSTVHPTPPHRAHHRQRRRTDHLHPQRNRRTAMTAHPPWHHTTTLTPDRAPASVSIVLGEGRATCTLTLHGHPVQHATAYGNHSRATCTSTTTP